MTAAPLSGMPRHPADAGRAAEAQLRLVPPQAARAPRAPFVLLVFGLLAVGLLALLLLNTALAQGAFRQHDLQRQGLLLADRQQQLDSALTRQRSPALLAARAAALGMVPGQAVRYVRLSDGRVVVQLTGVRVAPAPAPVARPTPAPRPAGKPATGKPGPARPGPAGPTTGAKPGVRPGPTPRPTPTATTSPR